MGKALCVVILGLSTALAVSGCGAAEEAVQSAADQATEAAKDKASEVADDAKDRVVEEAQKRASDLLTSGASIDPNTVSESDVAMALRLAGVDDPDQVAKDIKAAGPFTNENLRGKLEEKLKPHGVTDSQIEQLMGVLRVPGE